MLKCCKRYSDCTFYSSCGSWLFLCSHLHARNNFASFVVIIWLWLRLYDRWRDFTFACILKVQLRSHINSALVCGAVLSILLGLHVMSEPGWRVSWAAHRAREAWNSHQAAACSRRRAGWEKHQASQQRCTHWWFGKTNFLGRCVWCRLNFWSL